MTPTSPLAGVLTGLLDGGIVVALVLVISYLYGRKRNGQPIQAHPVAEDRAPRLKKAPADAEDRPTLRDVHAA